MGDINIRNKSKVLKVLREEVSSKLDKLIEDYDNTKSIIIDIKEDVKDADIRIFKETNGK